VIRRFGTRPGALDGPDPSPDYWTVTRLGDGVFEVAHFPNARATAPCCQLRLTRTDADRATALAEGLEIDIVTLRRGRHSERQRKTG
jgi:hypothetical protein